MSLIEKGTWVEIEQIILTPQERSPALPEDTRKTPLLMRVSGFLVDAAELGSSARVRTLIGRELEGRLALVGPRYTHGFGATVPELLTIGMEVRR